MDQAYKSLTGVAIIAAVSGGLTVPPRSAPVSR